MQSLLLALGHRNQGNVSSVQLVQSPTFQPTGTSSSKGCSTVFKRDGETGRAKLAWVSPLKGFKWGSWQKGAARSSKSKRWASEDTSHAQMRCTVPGFQRAAASPQPSSAFLQCIDIST